VTVASRERASMILSLLSAFPLLVLATTIFLPMETRQKPLAASMHGDPQDLIALAYYAVPIVLSAVAAASFTKKKPPGDLAFHAAGVLVLLVAGGVLFLLVIATGDAPGGHPGIRPWLTLLPLAGIWIFLRAQHQEGWVRWLRLVASFASTLLAVALLLTTRLSAFDRPAVGAALLMGAAGMLLPVLAFSLFPRRP
jgi:hypothetical protein